ncbi:MAG: pyridoxamine 5'-phosphate oxidase family protein [Deltaproteobacteria bacterium]|nr:pyridoxamine 5'-phosphate oxidase family protein [Deltaproteobacteria bacterium]
MLRSVRRKDRELDLEAATRLLTEGEYGFLATVGMDGQAYGVPLNYVFKDNSLYFHCALEGHKLDNIKVHNKVSFCVVGRTKVLPDKFSTEYESAMAFGTASIVQGDERYSALLSILEKYSPDFMEEGKKAIARYDDKTTIIKVGINHITGKARKTDNQSSAV